MKKQSIVLAGALALSTIIASASGIDVVDDFSTNPLLPGSGWTYGQGSNVNNQLAWDSSTHSLNVHVDSTLPTVRLDLPIGATLTSSTDFTLTTRFSFTITSAPSDQSMEFAFGLVNHTLTGGDRTGVNDPTTGIYANSSNAFDTLEFNYFPNVTGFGGPTVTPTAIGGPGSQSAVYNAQSNFDTTSALPTATELQATLAYTASNQTLTLTIQVVNPDQTLTTLDYGTSSISLAGLDPSFSVDSLAVMSYFDGSTAYFGGPGDPSLVGDMSFQSVELTSSIPEPSSLAFLSLGGAGMFLWWSRRRKITARSSR